MDDEMIIVTPQPAVCVGETEFNDIDNERVGETYSLTVAIIGTIFGIIIFLRCCWKSRNRIVRALQNLINDVEQARPLPMHVQPMAQQQQHCHIQELPQPISQQPCQIQALHQPQEQQQQPPPKQEKATDVGLKSQ